MKESYCKYPAIIGIVIAVLIVVSIIWCCVRCCCCGLSCCCGCFSCFNRCCPSGRGRKRHRYADAPSYPRQPNPYPYMGYVPPSNPPAYHGPNTATFDVPGQKVNGDSLQPMPTPADARMDESRPRDDLELGQIRQFDQVTGVVPVAGRQRSKGGYRALPGQEDSVQQPGYYRGAISTHPSGSDLGAQSMLTQSTAYPPPQTDRFQTGAAMPAPYPPSGPYQPTYAAFSPDQGSASGQARPPSLLQIGRKPVNTSMREI